jgi:hypothetical protein
MDDDEVPHARSKGGAAAGQVDGPGVCYTALMDVVAFLESGFSLKDHDELMGLLLEACVDMTRSAERAPGSAARTGPGERRAQ